MHIHWAKTVPVSEIHWESCIRSLPISGSAQPLPLNVAEIKEEIVEVRQCDDHLADLHLGRILLILSCFKMMPGCWKFQNEKPQCPIVVTAANGDVKMTGAGLSAADRRWLCPKCSLRSATLVPGLISYFCHNATFMHRWPAYMGRASPQRLCISCPVCPPPPQTRLLARAQKCFSSSTRIQLKKSKSVSRQSEWQQMRKWMAW